MAFERKNLQRVGPQNRGGPSIFTFVDTNSTLAEIDLTGFMNVAANVLKVGDWIMGRGSNGYGIFIVVSNTRDLTASPPIEGVVDLSNAVAVGTTDSD